MGKGKMIDQTALNNKAIGQIKLYEVTLSDNSKVYNIYIGSHVIDCYDLRDATSRMAEFRSLINR